jgi:hypothetical protein
VAVNLKSKRQKSIDQENRAAKIIGGKRVRGSGSVLVNPGDAISSEIMAECKYTDNESISISKSTLSKIEENALNANKIPMLMFGFSDGNIVKDNWLAFPEYAFEQITKYLISLEKRDK